MRWRCWPVDKVADRSNYRHTGGTQPPQQPVKEHRHVHVVAVHLIKDDHFPGQARQPDGSIVTGTPPLPLCPALQVPGPALVFTKALLAGDREGPS